VPLDPSIARTWLSRWDRQQEGYLPAREEIFAVIADAVQARVGRPDPLVLDLGCGPGSLGARIKQRLPDARVVGVDSEPVLLEIARAVSDIELVDADLANLAGGGSWTQSLPTGGPYDAVVSTTALHWLAPERLAELYTDAAALLRPGGILLNGDTMPGDEAPAILDLQDELVARQAERAGVAGAETWAQWWEAIEAEPEFAAAVRERASREWLGPQRGNTGYREHVRALEKAGFGEIGTVWQFGRRRILAGFRR
jgi:SAM-dependent methyltransferase